MCEFGSFAYKVMPFGFKNAPAVFSRIVVKTFQEYIYKTMVVYFDDWTIYSMLKDHFQVAKAYVGEMSTNSTLPKNQEMHICYPHRDIIMAHCL